MRAARDPETMRTSYGIRMKLISRKFLGETLSARERRMLKRINRSIEREQMREMRPSLDRMEQMVAEMERDARGVDKILKRLSK